IETDDGADHWPAPRYRMKITISKKRAARHPAIPPAGGDGRRVLDLADFLEFFSEPGESELAGQLEHPGVRADEQALRLEGRLEGDGRRLAGPEDHRPARLPVGGE